MAGAEQLPHQAQAQLRALVAKASRAPSTAPRGGSEATPLGRYANTIDPPTKASREDPRDKVRLLRAERYSLLATARTILHQDGRREGHYHTTKYHRTAGCCFLSRGSVSVMHNAEHNAAFFAGLTTCGSVWACPVCTAKIQERRREEIALAMDRARGEGLQPMMVTLTFPHRHWDDLGEMLDQQKRALELLRQGNPWKRFKARCGYQGVIRALEVKHGINGWHPHTHELWFVSPDCDAESVAREITEKWHSACARAGLLKHGDKGFSEHAVDVRGWCSNSEYMAKQDDASNWGVDRELAKGSSKDLTGQQGIHPFGLLKRYEEGLEAEKGSEIWEQAMESRSLFGHYAKTMADRRKRQIYWTPGLKRRWGIEELNDLALAERQDHPADVLGKLLIADWRLVRKARAQADVLDEAEKGGWSAVKKLLEGLAKRIASCNNKYITRQYVNGDGNGSEGRHNEEGSEGRGADDTATRGNARSVRGDLSGLRHQRVEGDPALHSRDLGEGSPGQAEAVTQLGMAGI